MKYPARGFIILLVFSFALPALATQRNVQTYGATGNGSTDDTSAINNAIAAMVNGDELYFPCGTYLITSGLNGITKNNITIDGQTGCSGGVVMIHETGSGSNIMTIGVSPCDGCGLTGSTPLTAASAELSNTIQANWSAIGVVAGSYIYIEENSPNGTCSGSGCRGEALKVISVSGNTATLATAVHQTYDPVCCAAYVKKYSSPTDTVYLHDLAFNGSSVAHAGLMLGTVVNSTFTNVTATGVTDWAVFYENGYNSSFNNITVTHAGNLNSQAFEMNQVGNLTVNGLSINNLNSGAFGFVFVKEANGSVTNVTVDNAGTGSGRPFKLNSATYNTINSVTAKNAGSGYNGITINYYSIHNTFNNCVAQNNSGNGIAIYGDVNGASEGNVNYNVFNNCTSTGNSSYQFMLLDNDSYNEINGGTYTGTSTSLDGVIGGYCGAGTCSNPSTNFYVHNATITGPGAFGVALGYPGYPDYIKNACINNNTITASSLSAGAQGFWSDDSTNVGSGNVLNGYSSNLTDTTCGTAPPNAPTGLVATVN